MRFGTLYRNPKSKEFINQPYPIQFSIENWESFLKIEKSQ